MKKTIRIITFVVSAACILNMIPSNQEAFAREGCCKERKSEGDKWSTNAKSYKGCFEANKKENRKDKVTQESGLVWWDNNC